MSPVDDLEKFVQEFRDFNLPSRLAAYDALCLWQKRASGLVGPAPVTAAVLPFRRR